MRFVFVIFSISFLLSCSKNETNSILIDEDLQIDSIIYSKLYSGSQADRVNTKIFTFNYDEANNKHTIYQYDTVEQYNSYTYVRRTTMEFYFDAETDKLIRLVSRSKFNTDPDSYNPPPYTSNEFDNYLIEIDYFRGDKSPYNISVTQFKDSSHTNFYFKNVFERGATGIRNPDLIIDNSFDPPLVSHGYGFKPDGRRDWVYTQMSINKEDSIYTRNNTGNLFYFWVRDEHNVDKYNIETYKNERSFFKFNNDQEVSEYIGQNFKDSGIITSQNTWEPVSLPNLTRKINYSYDAQISSAMKQLGSKLYYKNINVISMILINESEYEIKGDLKFNGLDFVEYLDLHCLRSTDSLFDVRNGHRNLLDYKKTMSRVEKDSKGRVSKIFKTHEPIAANEETLEFIYKK